MISKISHDKSFMSLKHDDDSKILLITKKFNLFVIFLIFSVSLILSFDNVAFAQTESTPEPVTDLIAIPSDGIGKESNIISAMPKSVTSSKYSIPSWIKINAGWWSEGKITDAEYVQAIEYLVNQGIIRIK